LKGKIIFIHHGGGTGGAPISMLQLAQSLNKNNYSTMTIFSSDGPIKKIAEEMNIKYKVLNMKGPLMVGAHIPLSIFTIINFILHFIPNLILMRKIIIKYQPDIVHLNTSVLITQAIVTRLMKKKLVWHIREVPPENLFIRNIQIKIINALADKIILVSNYLTEFYNDHSKTHVIYNHVDNEYLNIDSKKDFYKVRDEFSIDYKSRVIIMIGNVQEVKGHFFLAKASKRIVKLAPDIKFLIVAEKVDANYKKSIKGRIKSILNIPFDNNQRLLSYVRSMGLLDNYIFTGWRNDVPRLLATSNILVFLPKKPEGFGRPLIEAMAMGLPIVANEIGPSKEICSDSSAIFSSVEKEDIFVSKIINLLNDPGKCKSLGIEGRSRVRKYFTKEVIFPKILNLYKNLMS